MKKSDETQALSDSGMTQRVPTLDGFERERLKSKGGVDINTSAAERAMNEDLRRKEDDAIRKMTTATVQDVLLLMDELAPSERKRAARAVAVYYEVFR